MKRHLLVGAVIVAAGSAMGVGVNFAKDANAPRVQFVYQSDTRGYYRPCG